MDVPGLAELVKNGVLGVLLTIAIVWIYKLHTDLKEANAKTVEIQKDHATALVALQNQRTEDAKLVVDKLLSVNDKWNSALTEHLRVVEALEPTLQDIKSLLMQSATERTARRG